MSLPYSDTTVSVVKSQADIQKCLAKRGIGGVQWTSWPNGRTILRFELEMGDTVHMVRLTVDPEEQGKPFKYSPRARGNGAQQLEKHMFQESRRLHRTLYWYVKAKLEAVEAGLEEPAQAWLAAIEGPRGHTIYQEMSGGLAAMAPGKLDSLPALPPARRKR